MCAATYQLVSHFLGDEIDGVVVFKNAYVRVAFYSCDQCAFDFAPGKVGCVHNSSRGVPAFPAEVKIERISRLLRVSKPDAKVDKFAHPIRAFLD